MGTSLERVCATRPQAPPGRRRQPAPHRTKKSPAFKTPGWEALLLSHIKAPAQGGKAGSGKPPRTEFNKAKSTYQANG
jgi:hypothetical protein